MNGCVFSGLPYVVALKTKVEPTGLEPGTSRHPRQPGSHLISPELFGVSAQIGSGVGNPTLFLGKFNKATMLALPPPHFFQQAQALLILFRVVEADLVWGLPLAVGWKGLSVLSLGQLLGSGTLNYWWFRLVHRSGK